MIIIIGLKIPSDCSISSLTQLNVLNLLNVEFVLGKFPIWISSLSHLTNLFINFSGLIGYIPENVLGNLKYLRGLDLQNNSITGFNKLIF